MIQSRLIGFESFFRVDSNLLAPKAGLLFRWAPWLNRASIGVGKKNYVER